MATEKVTPMVLQVDLQCPCCYKKIKKTLCKFPQIRDQVYDEKANEVLITVVCCSPEKIRDKLCCKGGKAIKSIKIVEKPKEPEKKPDKLKPALKPEKPKGDGKAEKPKADGGAPPAAPKPEPAKKAVTAAAMPPAALQVMGPGPAVVHGVPSVFPYVGPSHDAYTAGPYRPGYGIPPPPPQPLYEGGYYGHGYGYGYGYGGGIAQGHVNRGDNYFSEENPQTCSIM